MSTIDKDSAQSKDHTEEAVSEVEKAETSRRTISIGPLYSFFECNGNYIIQFGSTSENGILHDIDKRTTMLHNKYIKSGTPYFNNKELACGGWALRALGIIDDKSLDATICERKRENKGLNNIILIEKLNPYFNEKLEKKTIREDIETLLEKMDPGHATIIYARYNSETKKKATDAGINSDAHIILLIKTELVEDPDDPDEPEDPGTYILYDPSQINPKLRLMYNGFDTSITVSEYLTTKSPFEKIATCFGTSSLVSASEIPGKKISNMAFGVNIRSKKIKKNKKTLKQKIKSQKNKKNTTTRRKHKKHKKYKKVI
jgi:hypothetical protein